MEFQLPIQLSPLPVPVRYGNKILLVGSCFTEHIGKALRDWKFDTLQNPHGIVFDPFSVGSSLESYTHDRMYTGEDLVFFNELWQSWQHHGAFSGMDQQAVLSAINTSQYHAHTFLKEADWIIITLGTAFSYRLTENGNGQGPVPVANCHRASAQLFDKHLMTIQEIVQALEQALRALFLFRPSLRVLFTVSPVRHVRDGVVDNNRSKARLIESVHELAARFDRVSYFPAYELVIDILRDYRFFDVDMVHPNYAATEYVLEKFTRYCLDGTSQQILEEVKKIVIARKHKAFQPLTQAHQRFLQTHAQKTSDLQGKYPFLNLQEELDYFSSSGPGN